MDISPALPLSNGEVENELNMASLRVISPELAPKKIVPPFPEDPKADAA
jgi:hypothetical protein